MDDFDTLVARIYAHALRSDWSALLGEVARAAEVDALGLALWNDIYALRAPWAAGISPDLLSRYARYHREDPVWSGAMCTTPVGTVAEILPRRTLERTVVYQEWIRPQRWDHVLQVRLSDDVGERGGLLVGRRAGALSARLALLERLTPHVQQSVRIIQQLGRARMLAGISRHLLEVLPIAIVIVDRDVRIVLMNRSADELVASVGSGASVVAGELRLASREANLALQRACARDESAVIAVARDVGPLDVVVSPLAARDGERQALAVALSDPSRAVVIAPEGLQHTYGLTPGQAALTALLVQGHSLTDCAATLGLTIGTVRDRLKQVFARTGARRQADLVRLVLSRPSIFRRAQGPGLDRSGALGLKLLDAIMRHDD